MPGLADPTQLLNQNQRSANLSSNASENWTPVDLTIDGKLVKAEWSARPDVTDTKIDSVKVREIGSPITARARSNAAGGQVEVMSASGAYYKRDNGHVSSPLHVRGDTPPSPADFTRGAALLNATIASPEYLAEIARENLGNGSFTAVADSREVRATAAPPAPNR